ncbi:hypothetical protein [Maritimibacter dapengensis]|uniref:Uncharacterized protein n=1 Tax=Maritimibacter dapengensis TaxID=2836868 RepID=A0ABS6T369_9RHOB|nr:hypothetical protein [Maritimibacter dapengensis]MBV7379687.1 hypothetical protein [Maritimibacter dapengensis]
MYVILPLGPSSIVLNSYRHRLIWHSDRHLSKLKREFLDLVETRATRDRIAAGQAFGFAKT